MFAVLKEYWFGFLLTLAGLGFLLFFGIIASAPHDDAEMRGFTPCTNKLVYELATADERSFSFVFSAVSGSYICYAEVMINGWRLWRAGEQSRPWSNYFFATDNFSVSPELSEPISEELRKANLLDEDKNSEILWQSGRPVYDESEQNKENK